MTESLAIDKNDVIYALKTEKQDYFTVNFKNGRTLQFPIVLWDCLATQFWTCDTKLPIMINFENLLACHRKGNELNLYFSDCFRCIVHPEAEEIWKYICRNI